MLSNSINSNSNDSTGLFLPRPSRLTTTKRSLQSVNQTLFAISITCPDDTSPNDSPHNPQNAATTHSPPPPPPVPSSHRLSRSSICSSALSERTAIPPSPHMAMQGRYVARTHLQTPLQPLNNEIQNRRTLIACLELCVTYAVCDGESTHLFRGRGEVYNAVFAVFRDRCGSGEAPVEDCGVELLS